MIVYVQMCLIVETVINYPDCLKGLLFFYEVVVSFFFFFKESSSLLPIEACTLSFVLQIHPPLEKVFHLIPENAIMSGDDFVPGILEPQPDGKAFFKTFLN